MNALPQYRAVYLALLLLWEDPPIGLGESDLAKMLLGQERDKRQRGVMLQQLLNQAVESLRPVETMPVADFRWYPYHILVGEYRECRSRASLEQTLGLSISAYSRAKRRGIERVTCVLPYLLAETAPPPSAIDRLSELERRVTELEELHERAVGG